MNASLIKPRDAKRWSSGGFFYPTLTFMINSYNLTHAILPRTMERLDCLAMCTFYSSSTRVILLCTNLIRHVQNVFRYEQTTFCFVHNVFRYVHNAQCIKATEAFHTGRQVTSSCGLHLSVFRDFWKLILK